MSHRPSTRGSLVLETVRVITRDTYPAGQYRLGLEAPLIAERAQPGMFIHLGCDTSGRVRRPMSILGAKEGVLEILFKTVGAGTQLLSQCALGDRLSAIGPIGTPFRPDPEATWIIAVGGGTGIPPLLFLLERLASLKTDQRLVFFGGSEIPFPFETLTRRTSFPGVERVASGALGRLDRIGVPSALASRVGLPGTYPGFVTGLFSHWLTQAKITEQDHCQVFSCGPRPLMATVQEIASRNGFGGALCLEENMACAVGGCAGCAVPIREPGGLTMRRVCVDGPVFPIDRVLFGEGS